MYGRLDFRGRSTPTVILFASVLVIAIHTSTEQVRAEFIANWRFDNGMNGALAAPSQMIEDDSGHERHGQAIGQPRFRSIALRRINRALAFDGFDDRVFVPDHELFHMTKSLTIEVSIEIDKYPTRADELGHIVFRGDDRAGLDPWYVAVTDKGHLRFLIADDTNHASIVESPEPLPKGRLIHVAATVDDTTGRQSVFINGECVRSIDTKIRVAGRLDGPTPGIGIGNRQNHSNQAFSGTIAEVRLSDEALRPNQFLCAKSKDTTAEK